MRVFGAVTQAMITNMTRCVELEDGLVKFDDVRLRVAAEDSINQWFDVTLAEGRNREVRRLWESQEVQVSRLIRLQYGPVELPKRLPQGAWVEAELDVVNALRKSVQLPNEQQTVLGIHDSELDHKKLAQMRRSVKKHKDVRKKAHKRTSQAMRRR